MADPTTNYGWDIPQDGEKNWGDTLNTVFNDQDTDLKNVEDKADSAQSDANSAQSTADTAKAMATEYVAKITTTDTSTNINQAIRFPWDGAPISDSAYSFDNTNDAVDIQTDGLYEITAVIAINSSTSGRTAPNAKIHVNGSAVPGFGKSGYMRNAASHQQSSVHPHALESLVAGDTITVEMSRDDSNAYTATPDAAGCVMIIKQVRS